MTKYINIVIIWKINYLLNVMDTLYNTGEMEKIYEDTFSQEFLSDFSSAAWILAPILP